jgi:hypothetical protein
VPRERCPKTQQFAFDLRPSRVAHRGHAALPFGKYRTSPRLKGVLLLVKENHTKDTPLNEINLMIRVSGFGFRVTGLGFRVSGFGLRVTGYGFRV